MIPALPVGREVIIDEMVSTFDSVCEYGCPHLVQVITRRSLTITEATSKSPWPNVPPEHKHAYPDSYASYVAVDPDGTIWTKDALGSGSMWQSAGRRADTVSINGHIAGGYGRKNSGPFLFTNLTSVKPPQREP